MNLRYILYSILLFSTCACADEPNNTTTTLNHVLDTTKDLAGSFASKTKTIFERSKEELAYLGQEIRSFFRTPEQILLKQKPEQVAQNHQAVLVTVTIEQTDTQQWLDFVDQCNTDSIKNRTQWFALLDDTYNKVRTAVNNNHDVHLSVHFLQQLGTHFLRPSHLEEQTSGPIQISFVIEYGSQFYEWVTTMEQIMQFCEHLDHTGNRYHQLDMMYQLLHTLIQKNVLKAIVISNG